MKRFWISWYQPTIDHRPVYKKEDGAPFNHLYWCTGYRMSDDAATMCCVVDAKDEEAAREAILKYWPEAVDWRFCEEKAADFLPEPGRFPRKEPV